MSARSLSWQKYVLKRFLITIPIIFAIIVVNFILIHIAPGDPFLILTGVTEPSPEYLKAMKEKYGLDKPILEQLVRYIISVFRGDLGESIKYQAPVSQLILERAGATILLMTVAISISVAMGTILGIIAARKPYSITDNLTTIFSLIAWSLPVFWLAQMLQLVFGFSLGLFPLGGFSSTGWIAPGIGRVLDILHHLFLPALTIALLRLAITARLMRASMLEVLTQDYILTAKAKGTSERAILFKHALKNAIRPVITMTGMGIGTMIGGATMTEIVFSWPGLGRLIYEAVLGRDYPVLMGMYLVLSITVVIANFFTDIIYALIDPRVRYT